MTREELLLSILSEECCEVGQVVSKILRFGLEDCNPKTKMSNRDHLEKETTDVLTIISMLRDEETLSQESCPTLELEMILKRNRVERYLKLSKELGRLNEG